MLGPPKRLITSLHLETAVHMGAYLPTSILMRQESDRILKHATVRRSLLTWSSAAVRVVWAAERLAGARFTITEQSEGGPLLLECEGIGYSR